MARAQRCNVPGAAVHSVNALPWSYINPNPCIPLALCLVLLVHSSCACVGHCAGTVRGSVCTVLTCGCHFIVAVPAVGQQWVHSQGVYTGTAMLNTSPQWQEGLAGSCTCLLASCSMMCDACVEATSLHDYVIIFDYDRTGLLNRFSYY